MTEKLLDILKVILEKYLIPTIISVFITIIVLAYWPDLLEIRSKTNSTMYGIMIFCGVLLLTLLVVSILKGIVTRFGKWQDSQYHRTQSQNYQKRENIAALESLWNYVDGLSPMDRETLHVFIKTNNAPVKSRTQYYTGSIFTNENIMNMSIVGSREQNTERFVDSDFSKEHILMPLSNPTFFMAEKQYRLKDDFFNLLKYSYDNYHRISHFEEEN